MELAKQKDLCRTSNRLRYIVVYHGFYLFSFWFIGIIYIIRLSLGKVSIIKGTSQIRPP